MVTGGLSCKNPFVIP